MRPTPHTVSRQKPVAVSKGRLQLSRQASFRVSSKNFGSAQLVKRNHFEWLRRTIRHFHAWRPCRHTWDTQSKNVRSLLEQSFDFLNRYMTFYYIAINDGCMARLEIVWNVVSVFNLSDLLSVYCFDNQASIFQMFDPVAAAASARRFVNFGYRRLALVPCHWLCCKKQGQACCQSRYQ